jgi:hypothetical protein
MRFYLSVIIGGVLLGGVSSAQFKEESFFVHIIILDGFSAALRDSNTIIGVSVKGEARDIFAAIFGNGFA